eukprot:670450-Hanusia_phi.AAC.1
MELRRRDFDSPFNIPRTEEVGKTFSSSFLGSPFASLMLFCTPFLVEDKVAPRDRSLPSATSESAPGSWQCSWCCPSLTLVGCTSGR